MKVFAAHSVQVRLVAALGATLAYRPGAHSDQGRHVMALFATLNVPFAHTSHTRFVVVVPAVFTNSPPTHAFHAAHCVRGKPSWSQVPVAQATGAASLPAQ